MTRLVLLGALAAALLPALPAPAQDLDLGAIFNCAADGPLGSQTPEQCTQARDLLLNNCTSCHTFVPVVKAQKPEDEWSSFLAAHRERVQHMTEADFQMLGDFLKAHFNDVQPVPQLPPALEAMGSNSPA